MAKQDLLDQDLIYLAEAIDYYLSYVDSVVGRKIDDSREECERRDKFILESAVRFPLGEFVERRLRVKNFELEKTLKSMPPRRCDFYFEHLGYSCFLELKLIKGNVTSLAQDYFDDIVRLHFEHEEYKGRRRKMYFIACGQTIYYKNYFRQVYESKSESDDYIVPRRKTETKDIKMKSNSVFSKWLSFDLNDPIIEIKLKDAVAEEGYCIDEYWDGFENEYCYTKPDKNGNRRKIRNLPKPDSLRTRLILNVGNDVNINRRFSVGVWEVI